MTLKHEQTANKANSFWYHKFSQYTKCQIRSILPVAYRKIRIKSDKIIKFSTQHDYSQEAFIIVSNLTCN